MQMKIFGIMSVDFGITGQLLIIYTAFFKYLGGGGGKKYKKKLKHMGRAY